MTNTEGQTAIRAERVYPGHWKLYQGVNLPYANIKMIGPRRWTVEVRSPSAGIIWPSADTFGTKMAAETAARDWMERWNRRNR